jgi:hypothetical protein
MQGHQTHLSNEELLLFSDQELPTKQAARAREHVAQCELCHQRLAQLENTLADFLDFHEQEIQSQSFPSANARPLLKARLSEASRRKETFGSVLAYQVGCASLALLLVIGATWTVRRMVRERSRSNAMMAEGAALPRKALTPGSAHIVQVEALCSNQDLDNDPPVNPSLEQAVFKEYGVPASSKKDYALDYLITPALGGVDNIQNVWPQPYSSIWNARVKDQLEDHLHVLVCQGKVQLATAQNDMASDWIAAYKRYFNTDQPEPTLATASANVRREQELELSKVSQGNLPVETVLFSVFRYPGLHPRRGV